MSTDKKEDFRASDQAAQFSSPIYEGRDFTGHKITLYPLKITVGSQEILIARIIRFLAPPIREDLDVSGFLVNLGAVIVGFYFISFMELWWVVGGLILAIVGGFNVRNELFAPYSTGIGFFDGDSVTIKFSSKKEAVRFLIALSDAMVQVKKNDPNSSMSQELFDALTAK